MPYRGERQEVKTSGESANKPSLSSAKKEQAAYRWRGGDGVQPEEVAGVHFLEHAVQLGGLVVQEAQRGHCSSRHTKYNYFPHQYASLFLFKKNGSRNSSLQPPAKTLHHFSFTPNLLHLSHVQRMNASHLARESFHSCWCTWANGNKHDIALAKLIFATSIASSKVNFNNL